MSKEFDTYCVNCGGVIPQDANFCPKCGEPVTTDADDETHTEDYLNPNKDFVMKKPFYTKWWFWLIVVWFVLGAIVSIAEGDTDSGETKQTTEVEESTTEPSSKYLVVSVSKLVADLDANALTAKEKYEDEYVEITGRVDVIDASGKYICLYSADNEWDFTSVQCDIKNKEQKDFVRGISVGDIVTLRGKITSVGEVLGYYLDIHEFVE